MFLDADCNSGFFLEEIVINDESHLVLCYAEDGFALEIATRKAACDRKFFIETFFESVHKGDEADEGDEGKTYLTVDEFYEKLKQFHALEDLDDYMGIVENVQHCKLKSSTILRPYQIKGIRWMLKRELKTDMIPSNFMKMRSKMNSEQIFYYNPLTSEFCHDEPDLVSYPNGGMLCDEMGLGKTVEMISLMLMNPRKKGIKRALEDDSQKALSSLIPNKKSMIMCPCNRQAFNKPMNNFVVCTLCSKVQHVKCVFQREITDEDRLSYMCPYCWKSTARLVDAPTTFIVSPTAIKNQWASEVKRHVCDNDFKLLVYKGISQGWISPSELAKYDCVITDFNTLSKELYFAEIIDRKLRHDKKFEYPKSPLLFVNWWRVILDEAQMVENKNSRPSQMVKQLPAHYRWCTTGTPIEKGSIQHLYGLVFFLDVHPYTNSKLFDKLCFLYRNGNPSKLVGMLAKIMWRTCKKDVEHEIQIPEQKEVVHFVEMSDLQKCFYKQVHLKTKPEFLEHIQGYLFRNSGRAFNKFQFKAMSVEQHEKVIDKSLMDMKLFELNNATLKTFLEPLRNLRQDCTIASLFTNKNDETRVKQTLRVEQLHEHLVSKTSLECKSQLRTICSSLNGMAALKISEKSYDEAIDLYKQVLRFANDYKTGFVR